MTDQSAGEGVSALAHRARAASFDAWLFALMLTCTALAVAAGLYVSYTALRYVAEEIGGMPPEVATAFPVTIDAAVAAGLLGEWWLVGRRHSERMAFAYMFAFGLVFAALTVAGNALHGALTLSVQEPVELHIGGRLVALPWWIPIAVSGIPGLSIAAPSFGLSLVVGVWRRERQGPAGSVAAGLPGRAVGPVVHGPVHEPALPPGPRASHEPVSQPDSGTDGQVVRGPVRGTADRAAHGTPDGPARKVSRGTAARLAHGPVRGTRSGPAHGTPDAVGQIASHLAAVRSTGGDPAKVSVRSIADATGVPRTTVSRNLREALDVLARPRVVPAEELPAPTSEAVASPESLRS